MTQHLPVDTSQPRAVQVPADLIPGCYDERFSSASMLADSCPFRIGIYDSCAARPAPLHRHDAYEIGYVLEGRGDFVVEDSTFPFQTGQVFVVNGNDRHMAYAVDTALFFNVHFHPDLLSDPSFPELHGAAQRPFAPAGRRFPTLLPADYPPTARAVALLRMVAEEHDAKRPYWPLVVKGLLLQVMALLIRSFIEPNEDAESIRRRTLHERLGPALHLIEAHLDNPPSVSELACAVGLSPSRFQALFREAAGVSPVEYRNARRIILARRLLSVADTTISQVAEQCGFASTQQFNRVFRRMAGCTPGDYRKQTLLAPHSDDLAA